MLSIAEKKQRVATIAEYCMYWASEIKNHINIKEWREPLVPLSIKAACREAWFSEKYFWKYLQIPSVKEFYDRIREQRREHLKIVAENNVAAAIKWKLNIKDKDKVDYSFRMLENTDKAYNPKQTIEAKVETIDLSRSNEDILSELSELLSKTVWK